MWWSVVIPAGMSTLFLMTAAEGHSKRVSLVFLGGTRLSFAQLPLACNISRISRFTLARLSFNDSAVDICGICRKAVAVLCIAFNGCSGRSMIRWLGPLGGVVCLNNSKRRLCPRTPVASRPKGIRNVGL